jgi:hypothetical protein
MKIQMYRISVSRVVYVFETWSVTLKEENRLGVFQYRVLRKVNGPEKWEVPGHWKELGH